MKPSRIVSLCLAAALIAASPAIAQRRSGEPAFHSGPSPHGDFQGGPQGGGFHGPEGRPRFNDRRPNTYWQDPYRYRRGQHYWGYNDWNNQYYYQPGYVPYPYAYVPSGAPAPNIGVQVIP